MTPMLTAGSITPIKTQQL